MKFRIWLTQLEKYSYDDNWVIRSDGSIYLLNDNINMSDKVEVEFSIGILDSHGNEIYINDIVKISDIGLTVTVSNSSINLVKLFKNQNNNIEIIGNLHE